MTTYRSEQAGAKKYHLWGITVHISGSAFDGVGGSLDRIDQSASALELNRRWTNALIGAFPGAKVSLVPDAGDGPPRTEFSCPSEKNPDDGAAQALLPELGAQVRRLLHDVYQRMDWFIATQPVSIVAPAPAHTAVANPNGIARPNIDRSPPAGRRS